MATSNTVIAQPVGPEVSVQKSPDTSSEQQYWIQVNKFLRENRNSYKQGLMVVASVRIGLLVALFSSIAYLIRPRWQTMAIVGVLLFCLLVLELYYVSKQVEQANKDAEDRSS